METTNPVKVPNVGWMNRIEENGDVRYEWAAGPEAGSSRIAERLAFLTGLIIAGLSVNVAAVFAR